MIDSKNKKRVVFADDQGLQLEHIKVMNEQSCEPPLWSLQFLAHVTQGLISPVPTEQWTIDFRQPASDYLSYRQRLDTNLVSLENVIIKESESCVIGTVKVKNLDFEKEVFVRSSWDNWKSQTDTFCTYSKVNLLFIKKVYPSKKFILRFVKFFSIQTGSGTAGFYIYDTFCFKLTLPPNSRHLEFCVSYRSKGQEFWDSNDVSIDRYIFFKTKILIINLFQGKNYVLTNRHSPVIDTHKYNFDSAVMKKVTSPLGIPQKGPLSLNRLSPWSELDSWRSGQNIESTPYW